MSIKWGLSLAVGIMKKIAQSGCCSRFSILADISGCYVISALKIYLGWCNEAISKPPNPTSLTQVPFSLMESPLQMFLA